MRQVLVPLVAVLSLTAPGCITVEDFNPSWDKATIDSELLGDWTNIDSEGIAGSPDPKTLRFVRAEPSLLLEINPEFQNADERPVPARTLRVGGRRLLLLGGGQPGRGMAFSYEIAGGILRAYMINSDTAGDFLEARHASATSIAVVHGMGRFVTIKSLDAEALRILGEMTETKYWIAWAAFRRGESR